MEDGNKSGKRVTKEQSKEFFAPMLKFIFIVNQHHCFCSLAPCVCVTVWKLCPNRWRERESTRETDKKRRSARGLLG